MAERSPDLVKVEALAAFTLTRPYGQFHGDPESERNRFCKVPSDAVGELLRLGNIVPPKGWDEPEDEGDDLSQLDHDGDGEPGGSISGGQGDEITELRKRYKEVTGRGVFNGWDAETLRAKIAEAEKQSADGDDADGEEDQAEADEAEAEADAPQV